MLAVLIALAAATVIVLADSGLRLWFALGGINAQRAAIQSGPVDRLRPSLRTASMKTRAGYTPIGAMPIAPLRAAA